MHPGSQQTQRGMFTAVLLVTTTWLLINALLLLNGSVP